MSLALLLCIAQKLEHLPSSVINLPCDPGQKLYIYFNVLIVKMQIAIPRSMCENVNGQPGKRTMQMVFIKHVLGIGYFYQNIFFNTSLFLIICVQG